MKKTILMGLVLAVSLVATGCSQHLGNFSALSTGTFRAENIDQKHMVAKDVKGGAKSLIIFGIPIGGQPKVDQAVSEALSKNNGDFMQNGRLYATFWSVLLIGQIGYEVQGDVYNTQK